MKISTPNSEEYAQFYAGYIQFATQRGDVFSALTAQIDEVNKALGKLNDTQARFRNGPEEWSIKQIVSHLIDSERVFSYRLLRISRNDKTALPGFEQNDFVTASRADELPLADLLSEFEFIRRANILAIKGLNEAMLIRVGTASGVPVSTRALVYIMVGHVEHHMISLHEKYLPFV